MLIKHRKKNANGDFPLPNWPTVLFCFYMNCFNGLLKMSNGMVQQLTTVYNFNSYIINMTHSDFTYKEIIKVRKNTYTY